MPSHHPATPGLATGSLSPWWLQPPSGRFTSRCGPCLRGSGISPGGLERLRLGVVFQLVRSQPPPSPWRLGVVSAFVSFLQCAGPSRQVGGRNASQPVIKQPVATLLLFQAGSNAMGRSCCITSLPSRAALASFINVHLLGTAGAGSSKFTVCMDNVAQTQHVSNGLVCSVEFCRT